MGFIGVDKANDNAECWYPTAPTAAEPEHEDKVTTHDVTYDAEGRACCGGKGE